MKTTLTLLFIAAVTFCFATGNPKKGTDKHAKADPQSCLYITGIVSNHNDEQECVVELLGPNSHETILLTEGNKKFKFVLKKNSNYQIRISKKGFLNKSVEVNTHMLTLENEVHYFTFETELMDESELKNLNKNMLNYPVALIQYDHKTESFVHDEQYYELIQRELHNTQTEQPQQNTTANFKSLSTKCHSFLVASR